VLLVGFVAAARFMGGQPFVSSRNKLSPAKPGRALRSGPVGCMLAVSPEVKIEIPAKGYTTEESQ
jgi:hypothetical protein